MIGCGGRDGRRMMRPAPRTGHATVGRREWLVETVIGIALIVISALEIWFIVRTVQSNMGRA